MLLPNRRESSNEYRYGYQGSESDPEIKGKGNSYTTYYRELDSRVGRWLSIDPKATAWESPYVSMGNNPIRHNDVFGDSISTTFYTSDGEKTNSIPKQVQDMFEQEYGITVGYDNGKLYKAGDVKTDLEVSKSAKALWESELGSCNSTESLVFDYNISVSGQDIFMGGHGELDHTTYIDLADFNLNGVPKGFAFDDLEKPKFNGVKVPERAFNLARIVEHELLGHGISAYGDKNASLYETPGDVVNFVNIFRLEMGLPVRVTYEPISNRTYKMVNNKRIETTINREVWFGKKIITPENGMFKGGLNNDDYGVIQY